eukprot:6213305-Pleurochrysis_carterae.AAC.5
MKKSCDKAARHAQKRKMLLPLQQRLPTLKAAARIAPCGLLAKLQGLFTAELEFEGPGHPTGEADSIIRFESPHYEVSLLADNGDTADSVMNSQLSACSALQVPPKESPYRKRDL